MMTTNAKKTPLNIACVIFMSIMVHSFLTMIFVGTTFGVRMLFIPNPVSPEEFSVLFLLTMALQGYIVAVRKDLEEAFDK